MQTDAELLAHYAATADEAAFAELARRHGAFVYRVCRRRLGDAHEAEDAAQAVFLVLARRARAIRKGASLAAWLFGTALRVAGEAIRARARRRRREEEAAMVRAAADAAQIPEAGSGEVLDRIDGLLARLPTLQRQAVILRYLEGRSQEEAAKVAGCPAGTIGRRASEGIGRLRDRLVRSGCALGALALTGVLEAEAKAAIPECLFPSLVAASKTAAAGAVGAIGSKASVLAKGTLKAMFWTKVKVAAALAGAAAATGGTGIGLHGFLAREQAARNAAVEVRDLTPVEIHETPRHPPVVLVRDGQPKAKVFVAVDKPDRDLTILLKELVEVVKLSTGAELEVVREPPGEGVPAIVIGDCAASRAAGIDASQIPVEGFVVKTAANRIYLVGSTMPLPAGSDRWHYYSNSGTAWAVADFLERFVGVRWYWPVNAGGRSVIQARTLNVPPAFYSDQPVFRKREWSGREAYGKDRVPDAALPAGTGMLDMTVLLAGLREGNSWPYMIHVHMPQQIWKNQKLVDTHPELFMKQENGKRNFSMLCYGNQGTLDFLLAGCEAAWGGKKEAMAPWCDYGPSWVGALGVTLSPFDEPIHCSCETCIKLYDPQAGNRGTGTKIMGAFLKKFADEVKRRWPDKKVVYLPYWNYTTLPKGIDLPDNLEIQVCTMAFAMMRQPGWRGEMERCLADWSRQVKGRIQTWEYPHRTIEYPGVYIQYPHLIQDYYRRNRGMLTGSFLNGGGIWDWTVAAPSHYVFMKVLWNPDLDVDAVWDVMCERQFGKAAASARELLKLAADRWENAPWSIEKQGGMDDMGYLEPSIYRETWPPDVVAKMTGLWQKARDEAKDDPAASQRLLYISWNLERFADGVKAESARPDKR